MTSIIDITTNTSETLILHALDLSAPVARIHIPHRSTAGFHGNWIPDAELQQANG